MFYDVCGVTRRYSVLLIILTADRAKGCRKMKKFLPGMGFIFDSKSRVMNKATTQTMTKHYIINTICECILNQDVMKLYR